MLNWLLIGDRRSELAQRNGWSWDGCRKEGVFHCCAILLSETLDRLNLQHLGLDWRDFDRVWFRNVYNDDGSSNLFDVPDDRVIVVMGRIPCKVMIGRVGEERVDIQIPHPAARNFRNHDKYFWEVKPRFDVWLSVWLNYLELP